MPKEKWSANTDPIASFPPRDASAQRTTSVPQLTHEREAFFGAYETDRRMLLVAALRLRYLFGA
jgi:hypothetical protein